MQCASVCDMDIVMLMLFRREVDRRWGWCPTTGSGRQSGTSQLWRLVTFFVSVGKHWVWVHTHCMLNTRYTVDMHILLISSITEALFTFYPQILYIFVGHAYWLHTGHVLSACARLHNWPSIRRQQTHTCRSIFLSDICVDAVCAGYVPWKALVQVWFWFS